MSANREDSAFETAEPSLLDPGFVGIDPDISWLISRDYVRPGDTLTSVQRRAAELLAEFLQPERVDAILLLGRGTVRGWSRSEDFRSVALRRRDLITAEGHEPLFEAALTAAQRRAAHMEALGAKKTEIAKELGRHRATIHNWASDPVYRRLVERCVRALRAQRTDADERRRDAERREELQLAHDAVGKGLRNQDVVEAARLGVAVMRLHERGRSK